jgi:hypothetical protein
MAKLYSIRNWDAHFENNRTRKMKHMMWIPVPNKHDGDGYTELVDRDDGAEMLGAWLAILQVASKCAIRGTLVRDNGTPHTPKTIARQTRIKEGVICKALQLLCSSDVEWLQVVDSSVVAPRCAIGAPSAHPTDEEEKGIEEKEEKGIEGALASLDSGKSASQKTTVQLMDELIPHRRESFQMWCQHSLDNHRGYKATALMLLIDEWKGISDHRLRRAVEFSIKKNWKSIHEPKAGEEGVRKNNHRF